MSDVAATKKVFDSQEDKVSVGDFLFEQPNMLCCVQASEDSAEEHWSVFVDIFDYLRITSEHEYSVEDEVNNLRSAYTNFLVTDAGFDSDEAEIYFHDYLQRLIEDERLPESVDELIQL